MKKWMAIGALLMMSYLNLTAQDFYDINTINTIELTFTESNWDQILDNLYAAGNEERLLGSAVVNGVPFDSVGVRYKGNSSYSAQNVKNPLNIKLDYVIDDQTYEGYGTLKLSNGYKDPSFVRETLSYEIARNYMNAGFANYAKVYINGEYIGLYTSVQDVDKYFKNTYYPANNDIRFKGELATGAAPTTTTVWGYNGSDSTSYFNYYELESDQGWSELIDFLDVFNNNPDQMEDVLNVDTHLWMLAFDILLVNLDSPVNFGHNFYLFQDGDGLFNPILWDLNESFGVFSMLLGGQNLSISGLQTLSPTLNIYNDDYPIIGQVLNNDVYLKMYIAHMRTMIEEIFQSGWYETRAHELQDIIAADYQSDPNTFYSYSEFLQNINNSIGGGGPGGQSVIGLTQLMETRYSWLLSHNLFQGTIPTLENQNYSPQQITPGSVVWFNIDAADSDLVRLYYRDSGTSRFYYQEMYDDGNHNDGLAGDGTYGISLDAGYKNIEYYFYAQNNEQGKFLPARAAHEFFTLDIMTETGNVVINEINYHSSEDFDPEDWVELYNAESTELDISGWQFKDEDDAHVFTIPTNTSLAAGEYLVLCKDSALFHQLFPAVTNYLGDFDFGLSGGGEALRLFDAEGTLIDSVNYDDEGDWPTLPDGNGNTLELIDPALDNALAQNWQASVGFGTPGQPNSSGVSTQENQLTAPKMQLSNFPNPFNPSTTISFSLNSESDENIELMIFNLKGQKVKSYSFQNDNLGTTYTASVVWNGTDVNNRPVASGVYLAKLKSGRQVVSRKLMLLK